MGVSTIYWKGRQKVEDIKRRIWDEGAGATISEQKEALTGVKTPYKYISDGSETGFTPGFSSSTGSAGGSSSGGGGVGSSGPTPAQLEAQRLEKLRQQELLRKQQEEAKRLSQELLQGKLLQEHKHYLLVENHYQILLIGLQLMGRKLHNMK